jgi:DNA-binding transcriptional MerR regulator
VAESEGSSARAANGSQSCMSIGEVLAHLRTDFPDTTISKLRFLESEGLVGPERTPSGYRKYSWDDVARLTYILTAQRDHYLPLRVIREHLASMDRGVTPPGGPVPARPALVAVDELPTAQDFDTRHGDARLSRAELVERAGISDAQLRDLEQFGLVAARSGGYYDADALEIAKVLAQLAEYGLEPRHLRAYRSAADREIGLFEQVVAPLVRQRNPEARARAADTVRELAALSLRLHAALVQAGLRGSVGI